MPDIDSYIGLMHTLFTPEDRYGLSIEGPDGDVSLRVDPFKGKNAAGLNDMICAWAQEAAKLKAGEITHEDYNRWRYNYPKYDTESGFVKVPSQELSDALAKALKGKIKE